MVSRDEVAQMSGSGLSPEDRFAIHDLLVDYCRHLDRMDLSALAGLFTADCLVVYGLGPNSTAQGARALEESLARMWRWSRTAHHLSNVRIWSSGADSARSESCVMAWHERSDRTTATVYGRYLDSLVRTLEGWRIAVRRMEMNGADAGFRVAIPQAPRRPPPEGWATPTGLDEPNATSPRGQP